MSLYSHSGWEDFPIECLFLPSKIHVCLYISIMTMLLLKSVCSLVFALEYLASVLPQGSTSTQRLETGRSVSILSNSKTLCSAWCKFRFTVKKLTFSLWISVTTAVSVYVLNCRHVKGRVLVALADGTLAIFHRSEGIIAIIQNEITRTGSRWIILCLLWNSLSFL